MTSRERVLVQEPACRRCGTLYRAPGWGRCYLCGSCGTPLQSDDPGIRLPPLARWLPPLAAGLAAAAGVLWMAAQQGRTRNAKAAAPASAARSREEPVELPPRFEGHLREKAELIDRDLEAAPQDAALRIRQTETYLALAVLEREPHPQEAALWQKKAAAAVAQVPDYPETPQLRADVESWRSLTWAPGASPTLATRGWAVNFGTAAAVPLVPTISAMGTSGFGVMSATRVPGPGFMTNGPGIGFNGPGMANSPGMISNGPGLAPDGPRLMAPGPPPGASAMGNRPMTSGGDPAPDPVDRSGRLRRDGTKLDLRIVDLRKAAAAAPSDASKADALGRALEERGEIERMLHPAPDGAASLPGDRYLTEAAGAYLGAAERVRPRAHQAALYSAAAAIYGRQRRKEEQYRALRRALDRVPYSPMLWRSMQQAALQTGRTKENLTARRMVEEWTFPGLRARQD